MSKYAPSPLTASEIRKSEAARDLERIIELGVEFDKNSDGSYHRTLEGGHSHHRIFHRADSTGKEITATLLENVRKYAPSPLTASEIRKHSLVALLLKAVG